MGAHLSSMRLLPRLNRRNFKTTKRNLSNFFQETPLGMQESILLDRLFRSPTWGLGHQGRIAGLGMKWNYEKSFQPGPGLIHGYMNPAPPNAAILMRPILPHP